MGLYDGLIRAFLDRPEVKGAGALPEGTPWEPDSGRIMVLRSDMAYELGGELQPSTGVTLTTTDGSLVPEDGVSLIGPDLGELAPGTNHPYGRVSLVLLNGETALQGDELYRAIRELEFTRYHFYPKGFMLRISASRDRESVRVSREALREGISFGSVGAMLGRAFKRDPAVKAVRTVYVTDPAFDHGALERLARDGEDITKTIDHIFRDGVMNCGSCSLQEICEKVEGLRELHFANRKK